MQTREIPLEDKCISYQINFGKGELSGLDKKLLYLILSKKEQDRKGKISTPIKIKRDQANALIFDGNTYNITLSHSLLPTYKEETERASYIIFPRKIKGEGQEAKIKKSKWMIILDHDAQSIRIEKQVNKIRIKESGHLKYIPKEALYLKILEPETTYHPLFNNNKLYLISQFHQGITLLQALFENKIQNPILLLKHLAIQLQSAHDKGLIHLDLKPDNIIVDLKKHEIMIIDLGCAKEKGTLVGASGNAFYMAPERLDGLIKAEAEQDIYSFGLLAYQILVGNLSAIPPHIAAQLGVSQEAYNTKEVIKGDLSYLAQTRKELQPQDVIVLWEMIKLASNLNPYRRKAFHLDQFIELLNQIKPASTVSSNSAGLFPDSYHDWEIDEYEDIAVGELTFDELHNTTSIIASPQEIAVVAHSEIIKPEGFDILKKIITYQLYWKEKISPEDRLSKKIIETIASLIKELNDMIYLNDTEEETHWQKFQGLSRQLNDFIYSLGGVTGAVPKIKNPEVTWLIAIINEISEDYKSISRLDEYYHTILTKVDLSQKFN